LEKRENDSHDTTFKSQNGYTKMALKSLLITNCDIAQQMCILLAVTKALIKVKKNAKHSGSTPT
jgi:hypothetical protein